ncbi:hypothetical protein CLOP_g2069 [Closterium sp. NIES-67]|nr:hypothetical protein CLOP_g2069 [Closterium sp. NIES-67]
MPFGLTNAPSTFQTTMNGIFRELLDKCVIIYLDDILIYSCSREQHLQDLDAVFMLLHKNCLTTKGYKCKFLKHELEFLGHIVYTEGVKIDPKKIKTTQEWKTPSNIKELCRHTTATGHYFNKRDTSRIWVSSCDLLRTLLIQESHDNPTFWHFGVDKTMKMLQRNYYWPNMADDVRKYVSSCTACQFMKSSHQRAAGLLQPLDPPERPWQHITMDYLTGLPAGPSGNDAILVVVDRLTKMAHFIACQQKITAEQTAQLFIANVIRLHGLPTAIISDRDPKFTSNFWRHLWDQFGTILQFSSAYHPQTDGQTE